MATTAVIFQEIPEKTIFFIVQEDLTKYNEVFINSCENEELQQELNAIMYGSDGHFQQKEVTLNDFRATLLDPDIKLIQCGLIL